MKLSEALLNRPEWTPKGLYYAKPDQLSRMAEYSGPMPRVNSEAPVLDGPGYLEIAAWISKSGYIGWTSVSAAKAWARKNGGGSMRGGGAWVPGDDPNSNGLIAEIVRVTKAQVATDDESYKSNIRDLVAKYGKFSSAQLYGDPDRRYEKLRFEYEAKVEEFEKKLSVEFLKRL